MYLNLFMINIIKNNLTSLGAKLWGAMPPPSGSARTSRRHCTFFLTRLLKGTIMAEKNKDKYYIIGQRIKNIRLSRGMTLEKFGALFSAGKGLVSRWERGKSLPNPERIKAIAEFANISIEELVSPSDNPTSPQIVGQKIKTIRLDNGLTMEQFGKLFNTSKGTVNNWEKGRNLPNKENLVIISEMGGQSVTELLDNNDSISLTISEYNRLKDIEQKYNEIKRLVDN